MRLWLLFILFSPFCYAKTLDIDAIRKLGDKQKPTISSPIFDIIKAGSLNIKLEATTLDEIQKRFGGRIRHKGDAGESVYWLCYVNSNQNNSKIFWFFSDGEMGGDKHAVTEVVEQQLVSSYQKKDDGCIFGSKALAAIDFGIPGLTATQSEVRKHFNISQANYNNNFSILSLYPASNLSKQEFMTMQTVSYLQQNKKIIGIRVRQITSN